MFFRCWFNGGSFTNCTLMMMVLAVSIFTSSAVFAVAQENLFDTAVWGKMTCFHLFL